MKIIKNSGNSYKPAPHSKKQKRNSARNTPFDAESAEAVRAAAGKDAVGIVQIMAKRKDISEIEIARRTKLDIHHVRKILYMLHSNSLADYRKARDNGNGTYFSYWTFNRANAEQLFMRLHQERLQQTRKRLEEEAESQGFYICPDACTRAEFATAVQQSFKCGECGQLLSHEDNTRTIDFLREKVREMEAVSA
ncbi:hypothetical protein HYU17_05445 [Candidatus Woesearchaeota archaeon]|nr:hypothetical protein [Candidatus Woesearchaeota archaeon]